PLSHVGKFASHHRTLAFRQVTALEVETDDKSKWISASIFRYRIFNAQLTGCCVTVATVKNFISDEYDWLTDAIDVDIFDKSVERIVIHHREEVCVFVEADASFRARLISVYVDGVHTAPSPYRSGRSSWREMPVTLSISR